jgi:hypothetical protein
MVLIRATTRAAAALRRGAVRATLAALAALVPGVARAVAPPDAAMLPVLGARCDSAGLVRVSTRRSSRFVQRVQLEADAVVLPGARRVAVVQVGEPPEARDTRIPWSEVESLSLGRSRTAQGFVAGLAVGAAVGGGIVAIGGPDLAERGDHAVLYFGVLVGLGCMVLGTLLGAGSPQWTPLYP